MRYLVRMSVPLLSLLLLVPASLAQTGFPPPGTMEMESKIKLNLLEDGQLVEQTVFDSRLVVEVGEAFVRLDGRRQVDFVATEWTGEGFSEFAGRTIRFSLTPGATQPVGTAIAQTTDSDFPADLVFRTTYDAEIEGLTTLTGLLGVASGTVDSIPPGEAGLTVDKFLSFEDGAVTYEFQGGQCAYDTVAACNDASQAVALFVCDCPPEEAEE